MKSCHSRKSKRKLEDSYSFDSQQVGWGKKYSAEKPVADFNSSTHKSRNKSFDWSRSGDGFSGFSLDDSATNKAPSASKKQKMSSLPCVLNNSSEDEGQDIEDELISWHSSESEEEVVAVSPRLAQIKKSRRPQKRRKPSNEERIEDTSGSDDEMRTKVSTLEKQESRLSPMVISCPSSSQSQSPCTSGLKGSDWMKLMDWEKSPEKQDYREEQPDPDSAKKKHKKYLRGGFAESLFRVQGRERSCLRIWKHQNQSNNEQQAPPKSIKVKVEYFELLYSLQITRCTLLEGGDQKSHAVLFTKQVMDELKIRVGTELEIFAPWQELNCLSANESVILCTNYVNIRTQSDVLVPSPVKQTKTTLSHWSCPCSKDPTICTKECSVLSTYKVGGDISQIHSDQVMPSTSNTKITESYNKTVKETSIHTITPSQHPMLTSSSTATLRQCLENHTDQPLSFLALISRVFHHYDARLKVYRCGIMIEDSGTMAVIHLPEDRDLGNLDSSVGCLSWFSGLKVQQRVTRDRDSNLFSVIDKAWTGISCQQDSQDTQSDLLFNESQIPPCFCYILIPHLEDVFDFNVSENNNNLVKQNKSQPLSDIIENDEVCRISCTVRLLYSTPFTEITRELYISDKSISTNQQPYKSIRLFPSNHIYPLETNPPGPVINCTDLRCVKGELIADEYSRISMAREDNEDLKNITVRLPDISPQSNFNTLVAVQGTIKDINEEKASSWEECENCGSDELLVSEVDGKTTCKKCKGEVINPVVRVEMEIILKVFKMADHIVRVNV
ncbi:hypothetical protein LOTGIDRAFT_159169 [Lottia gigantea]|uniref:DUF4503 domain-containing protein n=1 Tax=Lottia gigantea TaxID=225164 RepID=V4C9E9_LOTGI|nr:hypothetical protein LOTGIDRAFT_159169 [Lottia gigantea]ESO98364.1 hypothetical protein LOTGIDRAFT_159169 [Lottia gigantea]